MNDMNELIQSGWSTRPERTGPVTCATCGCRLTEARGLEGVAWRHFQSVPDRDARGCRPRCLEDLHRRDGTVLPVRALDSLPGREPAGADADSAAA